jgi:hypothetical protein
VRKFRTRIKTTINKTSPFPHLSKENVENPLALRAFANISLSIAVDRYKEHHQLRKKIPLFIT